MKAFQVNCGSEKQFFRRTRNPSSLIHTSTGYLTGNPQHLKNKGKEVDAVLDPVCNSSVFHNINATQGAQGIGDLSTYFMNQGNVQPHQRYRNFLQQVTDTSCKIQATDKNFAVKAFQVNCRPEKQFFRSTRNPNSLLHTSTGYLTGNLQHLKNKGKEVDAVLDPVCNSSVFHNIYATQGAQCIGDLSTYFMNQGNAQPHQQINEDEMCVNFDGGINQDMEEEEEDYLQ